MKRTYTDFKADRKDRFIELLATNPSDKKLVELCQEWRIEPSWFGSFEQGVLLHRGETIANIAKTLKD